MPRRRRSDPLRRAHLDAALRGVRRAATTAAKAHGGPDADAAMGALAAVVAGVLRDVLGPHVPAGATLLRSGLHHLADGADGPRRN